MFRTNVECTTRSETGYENLEPGKTITKEMLFWYPTAYAGKGGWYLHTKVEVHRISSTIYDVYLWQDAIPKMMFRQISNQPFHRVLMSIRAKIDERFLAHVMEWNDWDAQTLLEGWEPKDFQLDCYRAHVIPD